MNNDKLAVLGVLLLLALVALNDAYNFDDPVYNQVLAGELDDLADAQGDGGRSASNVHSRSRRDEEAVTDKCHRKRSKFCCAEESLQKAHEADKQIKRDCYKQITGKEKATHNFFLSNDPFKCDADKVEKAKREMTCVAQCLGEKKQLVDTDGNLLDDKVRQEVRSKFESETWLAPKLDAIIDKCLAEAKKAPPKNGDNCNGAGIQFGHCFWRELQFSCPVEQIKDLKACDKVRERINSHPEFPFPIPKVDEE